jgi:DNA-binding SARP family transcriptional activator
LIQPWNYLPPNHALAHVMTKTTIHLLGKLCVRRNEQVIGSLDGCKVQELFAYLLLYRDRPHPRETLAGLLWCDSPVERSKKYLRQSLWQLQSVIGSQSTSNSLLLVEPHWIQVNQKSQFWLDLEVFERVYKQVQGVPGRQLNAERVEALHSAVRLYKGDLLEGCYQDWCLYERERLQGMYLAMLDKLSGYSEARGDYESGLEFGLRILRYDRARECTHRRMMRLYYLAGDRTGALHQYERCVAALNEELAVKPAQSTVALHEQIRADRLTSPKMHFIGLDQPREEIAAGPSTASRAMGQIRVPLPEVRDRLIHLQEVLANVQSLVRQDIQAIELLLNHRF